MADIKLVDIKEPEFVIELADGTEKVYQMMDLGRRLQAILPDDVDEKNVFEFIDPVKEIFAIDGLTDFQVVTVLMQFKERFEELESEFDVKKKEPEQPQPSVGSTA